MSSKSSSTLVGDILVEHGVISLAQKHEAVCKQHGSERMIGEVLQDLGYITVSQLNAALADQQWRRRRRKGPAEPETQSSSTA
jgi:hypothetical protein